MAAFLETVFESLFKYRPLVFQRGEFTWASSLPAWVILTAGFLLAGPVIWMYTRARGRTTMRDRIVLSVGRLAIFVLVLFCLLRPTLLVKRAVPQQSYLAVLIDDSRSMRIADDTKKPRTQFIEKRCRGINSLSFSVIRRP